jgi:hypothetical protein
MSWIKDCIMRIFITSVLHQSENLKGSDQLGDISIDARVILK